MINFGSSKLGVSMPKGSKTEETNDKIPRLILGYSLVIGLNVNAKDTDAFRVLCRVNPQCNIEDYIMIVHVFGKVDSPCCTNWALRNTSIDSELDVKNTIERNFYMDDFLKSLSNVDDLINLSKRVMSVLHCHGFRLTKWMSNSPEFDCSII